MRKQKLVLILMLFISANVFAQSGWVDVSNPLSYGNLKKIYFFSENNFLVTTNSNYYLTSSDAGSTWIKNTLNFDSAAFTEYVYSAPNVIFASKILTLNPRTDQLLKSTNNGISFDTINYTNYFYWNNLNFINAQTGFVVKRYYSTSGTDFLLRTSNGGLTWDTSYKFIRAFAINFGSTESFEGYKIGPVDIGYATYVRGYGPPGPYYDCTIKKTTNGGITWGSALPINTSGESYRAVVYSDSSWVYFMRVTKLLRYKSTSSLIDTISNLNGTYYFKNRKEGFCYSNTNFLSTKDSSHSWQELPFINGITVISFYNNSTGFVLTSGGKIYKTVDGGVLVSQISTKSPDNFSLQQNYPNPFNPSTRINYELKITNYVSLKVFDLLGKEVASLVNEKQSAGSYAVDFNSSEYNLPSGIYFYTLTAGEFKETRKLVLIK